ncbi:hypothetical protein WJX79_003891 [Trebouxia sp. C0005]
MPGCQVANARRSQVWAEALDAWLQQLAQETVQEHTSQALTPANIQASLQLLLEKGTCRCTHDFLTADSCLPGLVLLLSETQVSEIQDSEVAHQGRHNKIGQDMSGKSGLACAQVWGGFAKASHRNEVQSIKDLLHLRGQLGHSRALRKPSSTAVPSSEPDCTRSCSPIPTAYRVSTSLCS